MRATAEDHREPRYDGDGKLLGHRILRPGHPDYEKWTADGKPVLELPQAEQAPPAKREKWCYVGAPAIFALELACKHICDAFGGYGCYGVGSAWERPDFRDVDVRLIMDDDEFDVLFPGVNWKRSRAATWEFDPRWLLLTTALSAHLSKATGLPVDFQFQPQSHANSKHNGSRHPLGLRFAKDA